MIVDANVLVSAVVGRSFALVRTVQDNGHDLFVPVPQFREAELNGLRVAAGKGLNGPLLVRRVLDLVQPIEPAVYKSLEQVARTRLDEAPSAQKDWPLLALALTTGHSIWTNDPDLFGTGVATWKTINIRHARPVMSWPEAS